MAADSSTDSSSSDSSSSDSSSAGPLGGYAPGDSNYNLIKFALQATYDYYDYFWRGEGRRWNLSDRRPSFMDLPVPKTRTRPPRGARPGRDQPVRQYRQFGRMGLRQERPGALAQVEEQIQQGHFPVKAALDPLDISISKILGWGGQAVAVLCELLGDGGQREKVVVKCQKPGRSDLASEIAHMDRLSGARHIVGKREYVPRRFRNPQNDSDRAIAIQAGILSAEGEPLTRKDIFAMELMPNNSLENLLKKASKAGVHFRNRELWKIFQCLLKACIALAYPDSWGGGDTHDETIPRRDDGSLLPIQNAIIHFDISTDNVFIGDFDSTPGPLSHDTVPIFKIGDLGLAESFSQADRADMFTMVGRRRVGKSVCFTPEQFTDDWNHLTNAPISEGEETAGNYDSWTNVYGIGLIMWQLITQTMTEMPPQPTRLRLPETAGASAEDSETWTYGGMVQNPEFDHYDSQLKYLVMWCLVDQPSLRPTLTAAQDMITAALAKNWIDLGDDHPSRTSIESLLRDPPAASATVRPPILNQSIPGDLGLQALTLQPGGPAPNPPAAPAQDVPDPVGPAPIPVAVYAGPNGFYTRVGDSGGTLHELEVHNNGDNRHSFVVLRDIRTYVVDVGAADPSAARGSPATPIPVSTHAGGQDGRAYATAWRPGFSVEELVVHTDVTNNTHYVEFDGRRTSILLMAGMPPRQA